MKGGGLMVNIVIVEDDFIVRQGLIQIIEWEKNGFQICGQASNGKEGFEKVRELKPDIVITDVKMPIEDGIVLCERIKTHYPHIKIIILSGHAEFSYAQQALRLGVNEYLIKPIKDEALLSVLFKIKGDMLQEESEFSRVIFDIHKEQSELLTEIRTYQGENLEKILIQLFKRASESKVEFCQLKTRCIELVTNTHLVLKEMTIDLSEEFTMQSNFIGRLEQARTIGTLYSEMNDFFKSIQECLMNNVNRKSSLIARKAVEYVEKNYWREIKIEDVVKEIFITPNYFSQIFKSYMGVSFIDYLNSFRVEKAKVLLKEMDLKVYQVAEQVGYKNYKHFNVIFKKYTGESPKEYRDKYIDVL